MKPRHHFIAITCLVMLATAGVVWMATENRNSLMAASNSQERAYRADLALTRQHENLMYALATDLQSVPLDISLIDEHHQTVPLGELSGGKERLVLVINDRQCDACVESLLFMLKRRSDRLGHEDFIVLTGSPSIETDRWMKKRMILNGIKFLHIEQNHTGLPAEELNSPYFFVLQQDLTARMTYIHSSENPDQTEMYLNMVSQRFTKNRTR